ncbi:MAG: fasciclin domain-containing protein [Caulobacteraceae bacterium]|nr:fasciclin domain-containing protein [Caulobacteraceae bacterium]
MLRARLLTATAAVALFGAGAAFAQDAAPAQTAPAQPAAEATAQAQTPASTNTVVDVLRERGEFSTLLSALDAAQLTDTLRTQPAVSIFAPTDSAFAALPEAERTRLLDPANVNELRQLLLYHVIVADVNSSQIEGALGGVETAARTQVQLDGTGDAIKVDAATVTKADIDAGNGAIFVIDRVLNPAQSLVATGDAEEATTPPAADAAATPPVSDEVEPVAPADDATTTDDGMEADTDAGEVAPPTNPAPQATTGVDAEIKAPNGEVATSVETVASPPVPNPTDGQQDDTTETEEPQS